MYIGRYKKCNSHNSSHYYGDEVLYVHWHSALCRGKECNQPVVQRCDPHYPKCQLQGFNLLVGFIFPVSPKISRCTEGRQTAQQLHKSRHSVSSATHGPSARTVLQRRRHSLDTTAGYRSEVLAVLFFRRWYWANSKIYLCDVQDSISRVLGATMR